jgi:hypothetical protein
MKTLKVFSLALAVTLMAALPAGAGARRPRSLLFEGCYDQAASVQIPRSQAQAFLPEGFTATGGAAGQTEVVHLYITSFVCGEDEPTLEMYRTYVSVDVPAGLQGNSTAQYFVVDSGASGAAAARLGKFLCTDLEEADVEADQTLTPGALGQPGAGTSTITSPSLSATLTVAGAGMGIEGESLNRWFFQNEAGETDYYDTFEYIKAVNMGSGEIRFAQEYQGLPLVSPAASLHRTKNATVFPSQSCRSTR